MAKNYISIYCNGVKIRSTGSEKWYRDCVLNDLGIGIPELLKDERFSGDRSQILDRLLIEMRSQIFDTGTGECIFTVEYVRKTVKDKKVLGYFFVPFILNGILNKFDGADPSLETLHRAGCLYDTCNGRSCPYKDALNEIHAERKCVDENGDNSLFCRGEYPIEEV